MKAATKKRAAKKDGRAAIITLTDPRGKRTAVRAEDIVSINEDYSDGVWVNTKTDQSYQTTDFVKTLLQWRAALA